MSKRVILICISFCLAGFFFGWGLGGLLMAGAWNQLSGAVMIVCCLAGFSLLPAGIGMLLGYRVARTVSVAAFVPGYLACAALMAAPLLGALFSGVRIAGMLQGYGACFAVALMLLGVLLLLHWTLYSPPFEEHLS